MKSVIAENSRDAPYNIETLLGIKYHGSSLPVKCIFVYRVVGISIDKVHKVTKFSIYGNQVAIL